MRPKEAVIANSCSLMPGLGLSCYMEAGQDYNGGGGGEREWP